ncbi:hypothetical protein EVAR_21315_1 [Eumeta japonica]|uniref:Endonuclease/exonuclease/phosphatase domain-containing protein n=1 Tax=Eumeta variegata TaxID=151549 RepID=A0A4C1ZSV9_EUMVA|nr:hypothetical protein EVAR_21315_1 [Eumeta japonica]
MANSILLCNDRITQRLGGTLIYYEKSLHCIPIETSDFIHLQASVHRPMIITVWPSIDHYYFYVLPPFKILLIDSLEKLLNLDSTVIIASDLNSKCECCGSRARNTKDCILESVTNMLCFETISSFRPAHCPNNRKCRPDFLDIV